jgi:Flp pilus assembly protein TadG
MNMRYHNQPRSGVAVVEVAITAPVAFLLVIGLIVGGLGTFRYQQVAALAREGSTYAALHSPYYESRTGQPRATSDSVMSNAVLPLAAGLDASAINCTLTFDTSANTATVKLTYNWLPEGLLPPVTLGSTSVMFLEQ